MNVAAQSSTPMVPGTKRRLLGRFALFPACSDVDGVLLGLLSAQISQSILPTGAGAGTVTTCLARAISIPSKIPCS